MSNQQINRKQLEKAVLEKRKRLGKPLSPVIQSPQPDEQPPKPITTHYKPTPPSKRANPPKPKVKPKESLADLERKHFNYGNWEWYTAYRLIPFVLWWFFLQPQKISVYFKYADEKHEKVLKASIVTACSLLTFIIMMMPFMSVFLGLSPINPWVYQHGIELEKWFVALIGLALINLLSVPFHMLVHDSELILVQIPRYIIRYFTGLLAGGIFIVIGGGILARSTEELFFVLIIAGVFSFILSGVTWAVKGEHKPLKLFQAMDRFIANVAEDIVGSAVREGELTLTSIGMFIILVVIFGVFVWIYFFGGWENFCDCPINLSGIDPFRRYRY